MKGAGSQEPSRRSSKITGIDKNAFANQLMKGPQEEKSRRSSKIAGIDKTAFANSLMKGLGPGPQEVKK